MGKYRALGVGLDRQYRNDLNDNFNDVDTDIKAVQADVNAKNTARISDINALDSRVDNIVASAGNSNTEIVDARGGKAVLKDRLDAVDVSLADITHKEIYAKKFSRQGAETDDTARIQRAIDSVGTGKATIVLTEDYVINSKLNVPNGAGFTEATVFRFNSTPATDNIVAVV